VAPQPGNFYGGWVTSVGCPFKAAPGRAGWQELAQTFLGFLSAVEQTCSRSSRDNGLNL